MTWRRPTMLLAALAAVLLGLLGAGLAAPSATAATRAADGPARGSVIVLGTGGLTWSDVSPTNAPGLWSFLRDGSAADLTIRSVFRNTCPVDGWLGLSSGARAAGPSVTGTLTRAPTAPCAPISAVADGRVTGWPAYLHSAAANRFDATLGLLGRQAAGAGVCIQAVGPGAALGAATPDGRVAKYAAYAPERLTELLATCPITLVDVGALRDPGDVARGEPTDGSRSEQIAAIDRRVTEVGAAAPNGANLIVASLSDAGQTERLRLVAARGPAYGPGVLSSPSTRQPGLVQAQDVTTTVLALTHLPAPNDLGGAVLGRVPAANNSEALAGDRLTDLTDYDEASHEVHSLVPPFFNGVVYAQLAIYLLVALLWKGKLGGEQTRVRSLRIVRVVAVVAAAIPAATFLANLVPWWRFASPMAAIIVVVAGFTALIAAVALLGPWGHRLFGPMVVVTAATLLVLGLDVMTGSRLQLSSLMGLQPVIGGRYYGMGNVTFALFATSALLLATVAANRFVLAGRPRVAALAVAVVGGVAVVVDGAPFWGADGGGPPALLPALAYLVLTILGIAVTWRRALLMAAGTVVLFLLVAFADWLRPAASRSHLGRFMQSIIDGGALDIVIRKGQQNLGILFGNYRLTLLVPIALVFVIYVLARPTSWGSQSLRRSFDRAPVLRPGLIALLVMLTIGFAINDSGVAIPAVAATIAVPFVIATAVRTLEDDVRSSLGTRSGRRGRPAPAMPPAPHTAPRSGGPRG